MNDPAYAWGLSFFYNALLPLGWVTWAYPEFNNRTDKWEATIYFLEPTRGRGDFELDPLIFSHKLHQPDSLSIDGGLHSRLSEKIRLDAEQARQECLDFIGDRR